MHTRYIVYWFRQDLRLHDNPALTQAIALAQRHSAQLLALYIDDPKQQQATPWGFVRMGVHRRHFLQDSLADLAAQLQALGSRLYLFASDPCHALSQLKQQLQHDPLMLVCEAIAAPEEQDEVQAIQQRGIDVQQVWQSSLLHPDDLPFAIADLPPVFSSFRQKIERAATRPRAVLAAPTALPACPVICDDAASVLHRPALPPDADQRSAFAYFLPHCAGGERAALAHLEAYFASAKPSVYKQTRNGLLGFEYSTKFSPWLALGNLSPRRIEQRLRQYEAAHGANDSTYWIWFELLWRDYFRFLHLQQGRRLYRVQGLAQSVLSQKNAMSQKNAIGQHFARWSGATTGQAWIDAGMRELALSGYLSNRLRQNVASFWLNDLNGDWRVGAAWFESQLIDYDVYSNQGNWLYLAGCGTDPRGMRRFNPDKQAQDYDPDGSYRRCWSVR